MLSVHCLYCTIKYIVRRKEMATRHRTGRVAGEYGHDHPTEIDEKTYRDILV
jgi:hypothetical protein